MKYRNSKPEAMHIPKLLMARNIQSLYRVYIGFTWDLYGVIWDLCGVSWDLYGVIRDSIGLIWGHFGGI